MLKHIKAKYIQILITNKKIALLFLLQSFHFFSLFYFIKCVHLHLRNFAFNCQMFQKSLFLSHAINQNVKSSNIQMIVISVTLISFLLLLCPSCHHGMFVNCLQFGLYIFFLNFIVYQDNEYVLVDTFTHLLILSGSILRKL